MPPPASALDEKERYETQWRESSASFQAQGCYDWLASRLDLVAPKKILDIGCGCGQGLAALRGRFKCTLVAIDENPYCLGTAAHLLRHQDAKVQKLVRFRYEDTPDNRHVIWVDGRPIEGSREVLLVQGDILLDDAPLFTLLKSKAPFDAVTVWLMGTYGSRTRCVNLDNFEFFSSSHYRCAVQNRVYELAADVLRPGGVLQVVDRTEEPATEELMQEVIGSHVDQASGTDLRVQHPEFHPYTPAEPSVGIPTQWLAGDGSQPRNAIEPVLLSVLSIKPFAC